MTTLTLVKRSLVPASVAQGTQAEAKGWAGALQVSRLAGPPWPTFMALWLCLVPAPFQARPGGHISWGRWHGEVQGSATPPPGITGGLSEEMILRQELVRRAFM